ncbi:hypothetical protein BABINDRAFT_161088 [Babjeviella inositovora NRRL Y-12698]|uniref:Calcineurin-like phosphoesterase domain-containing protein n=1 Tax=Babjeviella inositovora NRRL Y-12698 TaxID=984486 RepID=A0A1E3QRH7_9ASCO|nr:uncharacterized protein BABINDRAFT_161088 [Babjeviella inositovora NRRL Y-12698]ODQ80094.1 hypothetical protein BABINDRAFT_161088 [Babjeviella inositovora NRRL Y-12698]
MSIPLYKTLIAGLSVWWLLFVHYHERVYIQSTLRKCSWPGKADGNRIALLADPQVVDENTYPHNLTAFNWIVRQLSDNYLAKHFKYMTRTLDPSTTFFLGDLFDGGREWNNTAVWFDEYKRFNRIFDPRFSIDRMVIRSLPGNHDIGFGNEVVSEIRDRFRVFFGDSNGYYFFNNNQHVVVMLDTISLSSSNGAISLETWEFVNRLSARMSDPTDAEFRSVKTVVLLTHVPFYRDSATQQCLGPHRESPNPFPVSKGYQYQTVLDYALSRELISKLRPNIIFSGDDHDYCHVKHSEEVEEITVKTMSMTNGIRYPAIQLLTLDLDGYSTDICYLADPYYIIKAYVLNCIFSLSVLLVKVYFSAAYEVRAHQVDRFLRQKVLLEKAEALLPTGEAEYSRYWKPAREGLRLKRQRALVVAANSSIVLVIVWLLFGVYYLSA